MKIMKVIPNVGNVILLIAVYLVIFVDESIQDPKELSLGDNKLCSDITKRKVRYESLIVTQGRANQHSLPWVTPDICKFEVQSIYPKGGVIAVIQKLYLRRDITTGECIDYIQFRTKKGNTSQRHCGFLDARLNMNYDMDDAPDSVFPEYFPISYSNSFIDVDGELDVVIYIAKQPLELNERTEFSIVFTSYRDCFEPHHIKHVTLKECEDNYSLKICINKNYFGDGNVNCPHFGCLDEGGCLIPLKTDSGKISVGNRVIIGSISTLGIMFAIFILIIWAFRKHKLFCWAEEFAHPTSATESNRNSRVIEMNEHTGARLAETQATNVPPTAPALEDDKDLPPSYDSLFPDTTNPR